MKYQMCCVVKTFEGKERFQWITLFYKVKIENAAKPFSIVYTKFACQTHILFIDFLEPETKALGLAYFH